MDREHQDGQRERSLWPPTREQVPWTVGIVALLTGALLIGHRYDITLWDWLKLLVVPAVIAGGGIWFNRQQRERELEIAERRTQDEALQAYLDVMSQLLTDEKLPLYRAQIGDSLSSVARARTLTVLPRLDGDRKARVVQFLYEARLISSTSSVLDLRRADLQGVNLQGADLRGGTNLQGSNLQGANLSNAFLSKARLIGATLNDANLSNAKLFDASLSGANLSGATLRKAHLSKADLSNANLSSADLSKARLRATILTTANLSEGNLSKVDLVRAKGVTHEQLAQARSLECAIMPNGQKYEEWLKDKESHE